MYEDSEKQTWSDLLQKRNTHPISVREANVDLVLPFVDLMAGQIFKTSIAAFFRLTTAKDHLINDDINNNII